MASENMMDSGIEWVGEIPEDWTIYPAGRLFAEVKEKNRNNLPYTPLSFRYGEIVKKKINASSNGDGNEALSAYTIVFPGVIMLNGINLNYDFISQRVALVKTEGIITSAYLAVVANNDLIIPQFANYLLKSYDYRMVFHGIGSGIRKTLKYSDFKSINIPVPGHIEQNKIVVYLDEKVNQIDALIEEAKSSIEEYKAWKASIIYEAVTKGLDKDVEMKDSGVEWQKSIPVDWSFQRLKFLTTDIVDCPHETPEYVPDGKFYVIRTADQDFARLRDDQDMYRLNESEYINRIRRLSLDKDDIVYGREGERWGLACLVPESGKYCLGQRMMQFRCRKDMFLPSFAVYALSSPDVRRQGEYDTLGSTSPHVNISTIKNYYIPVPNSLSEQERIAQYLDKQTKIIDSLVSEKEALIADLESYKKSLIFETVTGKRKVV